MAKMKTEQIVIIAALTNNMQNTNLSGASLMKMIRLSRFLGSVVEDYQKGVEVVMKEFEVEAQDTPKGMVYIYEKHPQREMIEAKLVALRASEIEISAELCNFLSEEEFANSTRGFTMQEFVLLSDLLVSNQQ